ncbi:hypothetical protein GK047_25340 [Paenibacillus sp. SYP-B3998]|uniref:Zinc finger CGNR domain-containing protein n=1 Tax=Paenibacillus sp. SYP-B3998 TaxID=2678564 RepID=A0A6G4A642_9BACL|nr:hypothetical protein [Paenibacillus sp. SYP-B3998]
MSSRKRLCRMDACGNRQKAAAFYTKKKKPMTFLHTKSLI